MIVLWKFHSAVIRFKSELSEARLTLEYRLQANKNSCVVSELIKSVDRLLKLT